MKPEKRPLRALLCAAITIGLGACGLGPDVEGGPSREEFGTLNLI